MRSALESADDWELAGIMALSAAAKSLVAALALARGRLRASDALAVVRLEARRGLWTELSGACERALAFACPPPGCCRSLYVMAMPMSMLSSPPCASLSLQESHQYDEWGYVQGGHDIDDADFRVRRVHPPRTAH
jgi:hypothetical protein